MLVCLKRGCTVVVSVAVSVAVCVVWSLFCQLQSIVCSVLLFDCFPFWQAIAAVVSGVLPPWYMSTCRQLTLSGHRVLALACRTLPADVSKDAVSQWSRDEAETDMAFVGFLVLSTPLKVDSVAVIEVRAAAAV